MKQSVRHTITLGYIPPDWAENGPDEERIICGHSIDEVPEGYFEWDSVAQCLRGYGFGFDDTRKVDLSHRDNALPAWKWMSEASHAIASKIDKASEHSIAACWEACIKGMDELPEAVQFIDVPCGEFSNESHQFNGKFYLRIMVENIETDQIDVESVFIIQAEERRIHTGNFVEPKSAYKKLSDGHS